MKKKKTFSFFVHPSAGSLLVSVSKGCGRIKQSVTTQTVNYSEISLLQLLSVVNYFLRVSEVCDCVHILKFPLKSSKFTISKNSADKVNFL